ncbi:UNVERIFIED_CONTAM: hypothetical protein K2H54_015250, partial [Gekko kuhli]
MADSQKGAEVSPPPSAKGNLDQSTLGPEPMTFPALEPVQATFQTVQQGVQEPKGIEKVTSPAPVTEPEETQTPPEQQVGTEQSKLGLEPVTPHAQTPAEEEAQTASPIPDQDSCKTRWFNRDSPSGVGDEELLSDLQQENPNEICSDPTAIEVQTVEGVPASQTGQEFAVNYASAGFVCLNAEQREGRRCHDYQVRFTCPPSFCSDVQETQGTEKMTSPDPVTESEQKQTSPDQQAGIDLSTPGPQPVTTPAQMPATEPVQASSPIPNQGTEESQNPEKSTTPAPITELEKKQTSSDQQVAVDQSTLGPHPVTPSTQTPGLEQDQTTFSIPDQGVCQTRWFNRDDPSGVGDEELLSDLRQENPNEICSAPVAIEVQTVGGVPASQTGQEFAVNYTSAGFVCVNAEQGNGRRCYDYQVRFTCPPSFCSGVQETQGTEKVTTPDPVTEPELKQTSPDQQGIKEPKGTEEVTTPAPVTEPEQKQTSPDQQVGIEQATLGPQPVTPSSQTLGTEEARTTSSIP